MRVDKHQVHTHTLITAVLASCSSSTPFHFKLRQVLVESDLLAMPRFHNNSNNTTPKLSSFDATSSAFVSASSDSVEIPLASTALDTDESFKISKPEVKQASDVLNDLGVEQEYFDHPDCAFDYGYDEEDMDNTERTTVVRSRFPQRGGESSPQTPQKVKKPKSILTPKKDNQKSSSPSSSSVIINSPAFNTPLEKKAKISFHRDVSFKRKETPVPRMKKRSKTENKKKSSPKHRKRFTKSVTVTRADLKNHSSESTLTVSSKSNVSKAIVNPYSMQSQVVSPAAPTSTVVEATVPSFIPSKGVAIDTRTLQSFEGDAAGNTFLSHTKNLLDLCEEKGLHSKITLAILSEKQSKRKKDASSSTTPVGIETKVQLLGNGKMNILPVKIVSNGDSAPKRLLASDSWRYFGDLMDEIVKQSETSQAQEITIVTNDIALFTDLNTDSHKRAVTRLWDRMRKHFNGRVSKVLFLMMHSGVDVSNSDDARITMMDEGGNDDDNSLHIPRRLKITHVTRMIQSHISTLLQKESNKSQQDKSLCPMDVTFDVMPMHPSTSASIVRDWVKDIVCSPSCSAKISFDLPETLDGLSCAVNLSVSCSVMPYSLQSQACSVLIEDVRQLNSYEFEIVQLVPLAEVDLSLMFGVPLISKAALEDDLVLFREMQKLTKEMFRYLHEQDVAIVLRNRSDNIDQRQEKVFLLMAQSSADVANNGLLYQYVSGRDQILEMACGKEEVLNENSQDHADIVSSSFDLLDCTAFPMML